MFPTRTLSLFALAALAVSASPASAQQFGREGYSFPARSPSMAAQFEFQQRMQTGSNASSSAGGLGALQQYVNQYTSSSTSIANMNQVNQTATGGSTATLSQATDQGSTGSQDANAATRTTVDNSIVKTLSSNAPPPTVPAPAN